MRIIAIIPARLGASRFPGKPMAKIAGMPMIGHCWYRTRMTPGLVETYVATCDREIADYVDGLGGKAIMTSTKHNRATDRTGEAMLEAERVLGHQVDVVIMVQGDEPLITPEAIFTLIAPFEDTQVEITNLMGTFRSDKAFRNKNTVKVVVDRSGNAMYFSREPIPCTWKNIAGLPMRQQLGIIAFRRETLLRFNSSEETMLEQCESVDMNRVLENGGRIRMVPTDVELIGVDTPEDLAAADLRMGDDLLYPRYGKA